MLLEKPKILFGQTHSLSLKSIIAILLTVTEEKLSSLPEKCKYILLVEQYDNYDPFNDPFTVLIIGNDNALLDWS